MDAKDLYKNLDDSNKEQLRKLAEEIKEKYIKGDMANQYKGRVILFLGAAVNYQAPTGFEEAYTKEDRPPLGNELSNLYINDLFIDDISNERKEKMIKENQPLSWTSQYYEEVNDRYKLISKLSSFIDNKKTSPILKGLAKMHFKYIVTTNYDHLFENALSAVGKRYHKGIYKSNKNGLSEYTTDIKESEVTTDTPFIYKLHGDIEDVFDQNGDYIPNKDSIVLTDEDYLHFILRMSQIVDNKERDRKRKDASSGFYPIPQSINKAFTGLNQNTFLFIGYGLRDYNLRLIFKTALWGKDSNIFRRLQKWSIDVSPDQAIKNIWINNYKLTFIEWDIWCAIPYLYKLIFNEEMPLE
jgi:hypothetical protein